MVAVQSIAPVCCKFSDLGNAAVTFHVQIPPAESAVDRQWVQNPLPQHIARYHEMKVPSRLISLRAAYPGGRSEEHDIRKSDPTGNEKTYTADLEKFEEYLEGLVAEGRLDENSGRPNDKTVKSE